MDRDPGMPSTANQWIAELCDRAGSTIFCALVISREGKFQLAVPTPCRTLLKDKAFRVALTSQFLGCVERLATTPMDDLTIYRGDQNGDGE